MFLVKKNTLISFNLINSEISALLTPSLPPLMFKDPTLTYSIIRFQWREKKDREKRRNRNTFSDLDIGMGIVKVLTVLLLLSILLIGPVL